MWRRSPCDRWRIIVPSASEILNLATRRAMLVCTRRHIARSDRGLAVAARNVEHIGRLAQPRIAPAQDTHQILTACDRGAKMTGARRQVAVMQIIGFYPALDEGAHELGKGIGIVVDAGEQDRLAEHRN